ncbi:MAG: hypothetical protein J7641_17335 [Cyanobacteria bacterium SID2]|nr:hypothetical protein [Cyanobacteria bacterium SID2]MBP0003762.1 hypothetical protein [Cyanobacteria bacterium SBC]
MLIFLQQPITTSNKQRTVSISRRLQFAVRGQCKILASLQSYQSRYPLDRLNTTEVSVLLELRWYWVADDTHIVGVGANGRSPLRQGFRSLINSAYHPNSNRPEFPQDSNSSPRIRHGHRLHAP